MNRKCASIPVITMIISCFLVDTNLSKAFAQPQNKKSPQINPGYQSYLAHIAAANASLRLNETAEAKRWLAAAPIKYRNWEWRYLNARSDNSIAKIGLIDSTPDEVHYSPDGKMLIAAMQDSTIRLYDAENLQELKRLSGHKNSVYAAKISSDGARNGSCSRDGTIRVWDFATGKEEWQAKSGGDGLADVDFSLDGKLVASASNKKAAYVWNVETGTLLKKLPHEANLYLVAFSPDGSMLATGGHDGALTLWNTKTFEKIRTIPVHKGTIYSIAFAKDGRKMATGAEDNAKILNVKTGEVIHELKGHAQRVWTVAFSPDGSRLATGSADLTVRLWDVDLGIPVAIFSDFTDPVYNLAFTPDGMRLLANSSGTEIVMHDTVPYAERVRQRFSSRKVK